MGAERTTDRLTAPHRRAPTANQYNYPDRYIRSYAYYLKDHHHDGAQRRHLPSGELTGTDRDVGASRKNAGCGGPSRN